MCFSHLPRLLAWQWTLGSQVLPLDFQGELANFFPMAANGIA